MKHEGNLHVTEIMVGESPRNQSRFSGPSQTPNLSQQIRPRVGGARKGRHSQTNSGLVYFDTKKT